MDINKDILLNIEKPARYVGNEINVVNKNPDDVDIRFCFSFPDAYEVGMSNLGMQIIYFMLNSRKDTYCERVFAPFGDMESELRKNDKKLFSLETGTAINKFDFLGISLPYELCYTNILNILELGGIPILSEDRTENTPIVIAGGTCAYNPATMYKFIDIFYIGEGEEKLNELMDLYKEHRGNGGTRIEFLKKACKIDGLYVPSLYEETYNEDDTVKEHKPLYDDVPEKVNKVLVQDLDNTFLPDKQLMPLLEMVHDRASVEIFRGCIRGCRFCQAGYIYRPTREKSKNVVIDSCNNLINSTGYEEVSLVSLSTADYSDFKNMSTELVDSLENKKVNVSLPSLRVDAFNLDLMEKVQEVRKSSLTFAPEAGTQRLRDVINKNISEEEILGGCQLAFDGGWHKVKLYFMIGLPTETEEDLYGIVDLSEKIVKQFFDMPKEKRTRPIHLVTSSSCFIPKPFTAFQWFGQDDYDTFMDKQKKIRQKFTSRQVKYNYHDAGQSLIEGILTRGDRKVADVVLEAYKRGARFDGWGEHFDYKLWLDSIEACGLSLDFYTTRTRDFDEVFPWDFIDIGVSKEFFVREMKNAMNETTTPNCREKCVGCGATKYGGGVCFEK